MNPESFARVLEVFAQTRERPPGEQAAFLAQACPDDEAVRREVASLLQAHGAAADFLAAPAFEDGLELLHATVTAGELRPGAELGDCRIVSLLGEGGMGEVYLARDINLERPVAVKLFKRRFSDRSLARHFRHERRVLAGLTHPNIARLYGGGTTPEGRSYLVMEYVEGERLDRYCQEKAPGIDERLALFRKVCAAVSHAHQNLVVHRDLKPANVRVTPEGEPKLLDFGIAKLLDPEGGSPAADPTMTLHGAMTPEYASPEQIKGEPITTVSDVYSLGVVLYELLCGQRPFAHLKTRRPDELARAICEEEPPPPSTVAGSVPRTAAAVPAYEETPVRLRRRLQGDLDNIVAKALRKEPARRYASAAALAEDLRRHGEGLPVTARRDTPGYRAGKFVRRHKTGVAAGAFVVLALVAGLIVTTWQARVALRERDRAGLAQRQAERLDGFLEKLLGSTDPSRQGKDVKVSQVLDAAGQNLDRELAAEPEVLSRAHQTLSRSYVHLGLYVPAGQHARASLDLERRLHGSDDPAAAKVEVALADILTDQSYWDEADALLRHALAVLRRQPVPDHATLATALKAASFSLSKQGHPREAEPVGAEALVHARAAWGEENSNYANVLMELATAKFYEADYPVAEGMYRRLVALQDRLFPGGEHSVTPLINLGIVLFNQEKMPEARQIADRLKSDARRLFGEKSIYYAIAVHCQGTLDAVEGNNGAAIPLFHEALPLFAAAYPPGNWTLVHCRALLGLCLTRAGQAAEGEPLLRQALVDGAQVDRLEFAHTFGNLETALGECLLAQKRYAEAEPLLLTGHAEMEARLGPQNRVTLISSRLLQGLSSARDR